MMLRTQLALLAFLAALPCVAPAQVSLRITGSIQSVKTTGRNFGNLPKGYRAADWTVTSLSSAPVKVSLARILQEIHPAKGITILSRTSSTSVVQDAQGSNPLSSVARVGTGIVGGFATCEGLKLCPASGSWGTVALGAEVATLVLQYVFPTLQTHAIQTIGNMLPETLAFDRYGTASGMVIIELARKTPDPAPLDITITIPYPKGNAQGNAP